MVCVQPTFAWHAPVLGLLQDLTNGRNKSDFGDASVFVRSVGWLSLLAIFFKLAWLTSLVLVWFLCCNLRLTRARKQLLGITLKQCSETNYNLCRIVTAQPLSAAEMRRHETSRKKRLNLRMLCLLLQWCVSLTHNECVSRCLEGMPIPPQ